MSELKYKVGDRVRIKSLDWYNENKDEDGDVPCNCNVLFLVKNKKYLGTTQIVEAVYICEGQYVGNYIYKLKGIENTDWTDDMIERLVEEETKPKDMGEVSDGYHTFNELYEYRMLYNAALFNEFAKQGLYDVHKSRKHSDGEYPFGDSNWFIVMAELPTGQISNHYEMKDWDKFQIPEKPLANKWDEHSPRDVAERLTSFTNPKKEYPKSYEECCKVLHYAYGQGITMRGVTEEEEELFRILIVLKRCRDAYWKIAGDEMGLGKPWKPSGKEDCFVISRSYGEVILFESVGDCELFEFPTEEMRDAFYENFKELIEQCKELL